MNVASIGVTRGQAREQLADLALELFGHNPISLSSATKAGFVTMLMNRPETKKRLPLELADAAKKTPAKTK